MEVDLTVSQHGGAGTPIYSPPGFAAIMTLALEHSFYSGRSLWQMILGGVFERFPGLRVAYGSRRRRTGSVPLSPSWTGRLSWGDDWTGFAAVLQKSRAFTRRAHDYWADN